MGYDATNTLGPSANVRQVSDFLKLLGYHKHGTKSRLDGIHGSVLLHYNEEDYQSHQPIDACVYRADGRVLVETHTRMFRSVYDAKYHNFTVRQLQLRFGGYFVTDNGRGRFFDVDGEDRSKADSGCFLTTWIFHDQLGKVRLYLMRRTFPHDNPGLGPYSAEILSNHLLVPFIVSAIEGWFRGTYEALMRYSDRRNDVCKNMRLEATDLMDDAGRTVPLERALSRRMPFQNIAKACAAFAQLDPHLDLRGALMKPYRKRKTSLFSTVDAFLARRHAAIHGSEFDIDYTSQVLKRDIEDIHAAILRMYEAVLKRNGWSLDYDF